MNILVFQSAAARTFTMTTKPESKHKSGRVLRTSLSLSLLPPLSHLVCVLLEMRPVLMKRNALDWMRASVNHITTIRPQFTQLPSEHNTQTQWRFASASQLAKSQGNTVSIGHRERVTEHNYDIRRHFFGS